MTLFNIENRKLYLICFIPRSGSNLLCSILENNGFGVPLEYYFPYDFEKRLTDNYRRKLFPHNRINNYKDYFEAIIRFQSSNKFGRSSISGIKVSWDALQTMNAEVGDIIQELNPKHILLTRNDKIKQAISWSKALQTQIWSSDDLNKKRDVPIYDKAQINQCLEYIKDQEKDFKEYLKNKEKLEIYYENIKSNTIPQISEFLNVKPIYKKQQYLSKFKPIKDKINQQWYDKYVNDAI